MSDEPYLSESCPAPDPSINPPTQIEEYFRDIQSAFTSENNGVFQSLRQRFEGQYPTLSTLDENSGIKNTTSRRKWLRQLRLKLAQEHNTLPPAIIVNVTDVDYKNAIEGGFGIVIKAVFNGSTVAVKFLRLTNIKKERRKVFYQEALTWWDLSHPHILPFLGVAYQVVLGESVPCIVTPWMKKGNVREVIERWRSERSHTEVMDSQLWEWVHIWIKHITLGLSHIHSEGIIHGDLRGVNILINEDNSACLADFGLSAFSDITSNQFATIQGGVESWLAPEILDPEAFDIASDRQTHAGDIYSFACVCIELYTGRDPWNEVSRYSVLLRVLKGERPVRPKFHDTVEMEDSLWDLIQTCWTPLPNERPMASRLVEQIDEVINHMYYGYQGVETQPDEVAKLYPRKVSNTNVATAVDTLINQGSGSYAQQVGGTEDLSRDQYQASDVHRTYLSSTMQERSYLHSTSAGETSSSVKSLRENIWHIQLLLLSILTALNDLKKLKLTSKRLKVVEGLASTWDGHRFMFTGIISRSHRLAECILSNAERIERCVNQMGSDPHENSVLAEELEAYITSSYCFRRRACNIVDDIQILHLDIYVTFDSLKSLVDDRPIEAILFTTIADAHDAYATMYCRIKQHILALREELLRLTNSECYQIVFAGAQTAGTNNNETASDNSTRGHDHDKKYSPRPQVIKDEIALIQSWRNAISELTSMHQSAVMIQSIKNLPRDIASKLLSSRIKNFLRDNTISGRAASNIKVAIDSQLSVL